MRCMSLLLAQSGHRSTTRQCPLSRVKSDRLHIRVMSCRTLAARIASHPRLICQGQLGACDAIEVPFAAGRLIERTPSLAIK